MLKTCLLAVVKVARFADTHDLEWCELSAKPGAPVGEVLWLCKRCSQYATSKPNGLGAPCPAHGKADWKMNEAALHKRRRFLKGLHPKCGESAKIIAQWPLSSSVLDFVTPV